MSTKLYDVLCLVLVTVVCCSSTQTSNPVRGDELESGCTFENRCFRQCDEGSAQACEQLAEILTNEDRHDEAADAFQRGCDLGSTGACAGAIRSLRLTAREGEAETIIRELCATDQSHDLCRELTQLVHQHGDGLETDSRNEQRCDEGDLLACRELGRALRSRGRLVEAVELLESACDAGDLEACLTLVECYSDLNRPRSAQSARTRARALGSDE